MKMWVKLILFAVLASPNLGCENALEFNRKPRTTPYGKQEASQFFAYSGNTDTFTQAVYNKNTVSMDFQVFDSSGDSLTTVEKQHVTLFENSQPVLDFKFRKKTSAMSAADIVFVIDETGSMAEEIKSVKQKVSEFVDKLESDKILANLCLVTFEDDVTRRCIKIPADNPKTAANENLIAFRNEVSKIKVRTGEGGDNPENQLAAMISAASETPWTPMAQRVAILITDAEFHTAASPGDAGASAPNYREALDAIQNNQMSVYAVAPRLPGYDRDFEGQPSLVEAGSGKFYDILETIEREDRDVITPKGTKLSIGDILDDIATSLAALYTIEYVVDDNTNLDVTLPAGQRQVDIQLSLPFGSLVPKPLVSSMPTGRPEYKRLWTLTENVDPAMAVYDVFVDGSKVNSGYSIVANQIIFDDIPAPGTQIKVVYELGALRDNIKIEPIEVEPKFDYYVVMALINGIEASEDDFKVEVTAEGIVMIEPADSVFAEEDLYGIRKYGGLEVTITIEERDYPEARTL